MTQYDETVGAATLTPAFPAPPSLTGLTALQSMLRPATAIPDTAVGTASLRSATDAAGAGATADLGGTGAVPPARGAGAVDMPAVSDVDFPAGAAEYRASVPDLPDTTVASSAVDPAARVSAIGYSGGVNGDSIASRLGGVPPAGNPLRGLDSLGGTPPGGTGAKGSGGAAALKGLGGGAGAGGRRSGHERRPSRRGARVRRSGDGR